MRRTCYAVLCFLGLAIPLSCGGGGGGGDGGGEDLARARAVHALGTTATGPTGVVPSYQSGTIPPGGTISDTNPNATGYWDFDYVGLNQGAFNGAVQLTDATGANVGNPVVLFSAGHDYSALQDGGACNLADTFQVVLELNVGRVLHDVSMASTPVGATSVLTTWTSSDPTVVAVSSDGLLTAQWENACTTITWSIAAQDPDLLTIDPSNRTGTFAACVDSGGVDTATRAIWLPVGDVDGNLPGMPSGPPRPRLGQAFHVTWIVNSGTHGVGALSMRTEYDATQVNRDTSVESESVGGSTQSGLGRPFAVDPNSEAHATREPNATRWNDVDAFAASTGVFDLATQSFTAVSAGNARLLFVNGELADGGACNIWVTNPCMPYNSFVCPTPPPIGGYFSISASGVITVAP